MTSADQSPLLALSGVHAVDDYGLRGRPRGQLRGLSWACGPGVHVVLGRPEDGTFSLCQVLCGQQRPRSGKVRVAGRDPARSPALRRRIGAALPQPELPELSSVGAVAALLGRLSEGEGGGASLGLGLSSLTGRTPQSLTVSEAKSVELALALAVPAPRLLVLCEPLSGTLGLPVEPLRRRLRQLGATGTCVVVVTAIPADAEGLADHVYLLQDGRWVGHQPPTGWGQADSRELLVWVEPVRGGEARQLAAALAARPELCAVGWQSGAGPRSGAAGDDGGHGADRTTARPSTGADLVAVRAVDIDAAAIAVAEEVVRVNVRVLAVTRAAPPLAALQDEAARAASVRASAVASAASQPSAEAKGQQHAAAEEAP